MAQEPPQAHRDMAPKTVERRSASDAVDSRQIRVVLALCGSLLIFALAGIELVTHHGTPWVLLLLVLGTISLMWILVSGLDV